MSQRYKASHKTHRLHRKFSCKWCQVTAWCGNISGLSTRLTGTCHIPPVWSLKRTRLPQNPFSLIQRLNWWHSVRHWYDYKIVIRTLRRYMWYVISSPPNAAYMRQWIMLPLVQIMACRLFGAKPLSKPMLSCCQLHPWEQTSVKF